MGAKKGKRVGCSRGAAEKRVEGVGKGRGKRRGQSEQGL